MADDKRNIEIKFNTNADETKGKVDKLNQSVEDTAKVTKEAAKSTDGLTESVTSNGGAMSILDSVTGGYATRVKDAIEASNLFKKSTDGMTLSQRAYNAVVGKSTGALKTFRLALAATGIGAVIVLLGLLIANWDKLTGALTNAEKAQRAVNKAMAEGTSNAKAETTELLRLVAIARDETASKETRLAAIKAINEISPEYLGHITQETINTEDVNKQIERYIELLIQKAQVQALEETIVQVYKDQATALQDLQDQEESWWGRRVIEFNNIFSKETSVAKLAGQERVKIKEDTDKKVQALDDKLKDLFEKNSNLVTELLKNGNKNRLANTESTNKKLIDAERERTEELKKINEEYRRWQLESGNLDPSTELIEANNKQIEKLLEAKKKTTIEGEKAIFDAQIKMYEDRNEEILTIRDTYNDLLSGDPFENSDVSIANSLHRLLFGDQIDFEIDRVSAYRKEIDDFLSSIKNADLKTYFTSASQEMIKTADTNIKFLTKLKDSFNDFTEVSNTDFIASLRESQGDLEGWTNAVNKAFKDSIFEIQIDYARNKAMLDKALEDGLITQEGYNDKLYELNNARRLREEEAEQTHSENLQAIEKKRLEEEEANWKARVAIASASADAQAATLDMVLSFMSEEDAERAKATGAYKTLAIATATMDTYAAAIAGYRGAMATFTNPIVGNIVGIASIATAISTGIAQINAIRKVKVPGGESGGAGNSVSGGGGSFSQPNVDFVSSSENQIANTVGDRMQSNNEPIKAYVVASEVSTSQSLERNKIESNSL